MLLKNYLKEKHLKKLMEIVGLKHKVDDDINKLIAKFVGVKHREFIEQLEYPMTGYLRELYRSFKIDEDFVIEHHDEIGYLLFHKQVLGNKDCVRCFKNKRKHFLIVIIVTELRSKNIKNYVLKMDGVTDATNAI